jgi:hypothetical protein
MFPFRNILASMEIRPIRNDDDHAAALREIEKLWGAAAGTEEGDKPVGRIGAEGVIRRFDFYSWQVKCVR